MFPPGDTVGRLMELNCFSPELNFDFLPSYDEWLVNNSFNPFDSEPSSPISSPSPAIPSHLRPNVELRTEEDGVVNHDHGHSEVTMQIYLKDVSSGAPLADRGLRADGISEIQIRVRTEPGRRDVWHESGPVPKARTRAGLSRNLVPPSKRADLLRRL